MKTTKIKATVGDNKKALVVINNKAYGLNSPSLIVKLSKIFNNLSLNEIIRLHNLWLGDFDSQAKFLASTELEITIEKFLETLENFNELNKN